MKRIAILLVAASLASTSFAQENNKTGMVIGGVTGALLGSNVGHGNGKVAATAAGAIVGAMVGNSVSRPQTYQQYAEAPRYEQRQIPQPVYNQPRTVSRQCDYVYYPGQTINGQSITMVGCACLDRALGAFRLTDQVMYCEGR